MQEFINWIIESITFIDLVQVLATSVIAFATFVLWLATRNLARASKQKPFVVGNLESTEYEPRYVNFVIRNTGNAPAFDIKAETSPPIPDIDGEPFEGQMGIDGKPLDSKVGSHYSILILPPNQMYSFIGFDTRKTSMEKFDITISWALEPNGKKRETVTHSIDNRGNTGGWAVKGLDRIAREFEKTTIHLKKIEKHLKPPQDKK